MVNEERRAEQATVAKPVADLRAEPDPQAEQVNQALLNTPVLVHERRVGADGREWARVELPDYAGWIAVADLAPEPGVDPAAHAPDGLVRVVTARAAVETAHGPLTLYAGTTLRVAGGMGRDTIEVLLPGDGRGLIAASAVRSLAAPGAHANVEAILSTAREYLETPYVWGGLTKEGIDCSGFTQTVYRVHGYTIPRDADQQFNGLARRVERDELEPGDLIYLGPTPDRITHVGMYTGDGRVIHAARPHVVEQSMDPNSPNYSARFTNEYRGARRVIAAAQGE